MKPHLNEVDLYFITDSTLTKKSILDDIKAAIKAGVKIIQYREKNKAKELMIEEAKEIKEICNNKALLIINDDVEIAKTIDADGVHLGQEDLKYEKARSLLGNDKIIGLTIHNIEEAIEAEKLGADYIGASPIFETKTKLDAGKAAGLQLIKDIKQNINIPIVGIGGINLKNIDEVIKAGATSAAAISAIITKDDVEAECKKFIDKIKGSQ